MNILQDCPLAQEGLNGGEVTNNTLRLNNTFLLEVNDFKKKTFFVQFSNGIVRGLIIVAGNRRLRFFIAPGFSQNTDNC